MNKETIELMKKMVDDGNLSQEIAEKYCPELNEDEQHRKWILEYLYDGLRKSDEQFKDHFKAAIAWLEAQGEHKPANWLQELEDKLANATPKQLAEWKEKYFKEEPAEWSEEDGEYMQSLLDIINGTTSLIPSEVECHKDWLKSLKDRVQPKQWWSEEDEEIREWCISHFKECIRVTKDNSEYQEYLNNKVIPWLEKQGEQKPIDKVEPKFKVGDIIKPKDRGHEPWQIMQVDISDKKYIFKDGYVIHFSQEDDYELVEQKSTDKVEPKFHEGEWIVNNDNGCVYQVTKIRDDEYCLWPLDAEIMGYLRIIDVDNDYHLWTIQNAKDGDVLACENGWTCIFKTLVNDETFSSYCFMDNTEWFCETGSEGHTLREEFVKAYNGKIHPATKEECDLLFQKMKEAGYEWNAEKKELKKIEEKHSWSEGDEEQACQILELLEELKKNYIYVGGIENSIRWFKERLEYLRPQKPLTNEEK